LHHFIQNYSAKGFLTALSIEIQMSTSDKSSLIENC